MTITAVRTPEYKVPKYSVKQASELTGLTLNQVRLWERRYKLVAPQRAANGYRLYSQEDLDILRFARQETEKGVSIQVLAERMLNDREAVLKYLRNENTITPQKVFASDPRQLPNYDLMIHSITNGDPVKFERLLIQAQAGKSFMEAVHTVDLPILARIGELSMHNKINIAASHLAAGIIRRRILAHVQNLGLPEADHPVVLACIPNDYHELGLLCCMLALTQNMQSTLYLGPNVPLEEVKHYALKKSAKAVLISIIAPLAEEDVEAYTGELVKLNKRIPVALGGYEANKRAEFFQGQGLNCFKSVEEILDWPVLF